ncbi:MAG: putative glycoside hydrolase, partial [Gaiellales bacterium]
LQAVERRPPLRNRRAPLPDLSPRARAAALIAAAAAAVAVAVFLVGALALRPTVQVSGPSGGVAIGPDRLDTYAFTLEAGPSTIRRASWKLDGLDVTNRVEVANGRATLRPGVLPDGEHELVVSSGWTFPFATGSDAIAFTVDTQAPSIELEPATLAARARSPYELRGSVEPDTDVYLGTTEVILHDGRFALAFETAPTEPLVLEAVDAAGNRSQQIVNVSIVPRLPTEPVRGVHVTAAAWANDERRAEILALADEGLINTVELDLKDERGEVGYDTQVELARKIGAARDHYSLADAVEILHQRDVRVIGRLVAFLDPILASWSWANDKRQRVIQTPEGGQYTAYGGFTNFAHAAVRAYNIDVAEEAAKLGVDDILYDYVRRPDGPVSTMVFPLLEQSPEQAIVRFLSETTERLDPYGTFVGASVFGVAATRPEDVAQEIPSIASTIDYVSPMVYPSHWAAGEYGIADPNSQPYDIVLASLSDFSGKVAGRGARLVPWLQDFSLGVTYGPDEVRAQIEAARDAGIDEFLLWNPSVVYTRETLEATR